MQYQKRRDLTLLDVQDSTKPFHLDHDISTDYLVVGGGVAGLHAAQSLLTTGKKIVLIEKSICGGGMSGRSGGFLTPDSELGLRQFQEIYGDELATKIWNFGVQGQQAIVDNVKRLKLNVDLRQQDSFLLGWKKSCSEAVKKEHEDRISLGMESEFLIPQQLKKYNTGKNYTVGLRYGDCFGINALQYCQGMKNYLIAQGVEIYEHTTLKEIHSHKVITNNGSITFENAIFALGKVTKDIDPIRSQYTYGIQNFITVTEPLTERQIKALFPTGEEYMCRDTQMVFTYYRLVSDKRLLVGGGNPISSFVPIDTIYPQAIQSVINEMKDNFPILHDIDFLYYRSGKIESTKDMMPIIAKDSSHRNHIWIQGAVGLPWAASSGDYASKLLLKSQRKDVTDLEGVFAADRKFLIPHQTNNDFFKSIIFGICNGKAMGIF